MNATILTLDDLTKIVTDGEAEFAFLKGMWGSNRLAASALINRATGLVGTTSDARTHCASVFTDHLRSANGNLEKALNTRKVLTEHELAPHIKDEPLHNFADYRRVHSAIDYAAAREVHAWLLELRKKLESNASPNLVYNWVTQIDVELHTKCTCVAQGAFDKPDLHDQWTHLHHGDYNRIIWTLLNEHGMIAKVRRVWRTESTWPAKERTLDEAYHEQFGDFLKVHPSGIWFDNPMLDDTLA